MIKKTMKAAFLYGPRDVRIEETSIPRCEANQALIQVEACAICPSDLRYYLGNKMTYPFGEESIGLSGHEWAGDVVEIGAEVDNIKKGDRVVADLVINCGVCKYCKLGKTNLCINRPMITHGFAEYLVIDASRLFKFPGHLHYREACLTEPITCCLNGNIRAQIQKGDDVVIIGAGPIGLIHLQLAKASAAQVIVSEMNHDRISIAEKLGADEVLNPSEIDTVKTIKDLTNGYGADAVIVAVGNKKAIEESFQIIGKNGRIVLFAGTYPPTKVELDPNIIHYGEIVLTGSSDWPQYTFERALKLLSMGVIKAEPLVSHILPLDKIKMGFRITEKAQDLKVIIEP